MLPPAAPRVSGGRPSPRPGGGLQIAQWNTRELLHGAERVRRQRLTVLRKLLRSSDVVCVQEAHATQLEVERGIADQAASFTFRVSSHMDRCTGGLTVAIRKRLLGAGTEVQMRELIPGRASEVVVMGDDECELRVVNIHNYDVGWGEARYLEGILSRLASWASARPLERLGSLCGDWKTIPEGESAMDSFGAPTRGGRESRGPLHDATLHCAEIMQTSPTYLSAVGGYMARLDRAYTTAPGWMLAQMRRSAGGGPLGARPLRSCSHLFLVGAALAAPPRA